MEINKTDLKFYASCIIGFLIAITIISLYIAYNSYHALEKTTYLYDMIQKAEKLPDNQ